MWPIWCHFTPALNLIFWFRVDYMKSSCSSLSAKEGRKKAKPVSEILTGFFLAGRDTTLQNRPPLPRHDKGCPESPDSQIQSQHAGIRPYRSARIGFSRKSL